MGVAKPATQRPKLPSVGRLGLVEPSAPADLDRLGWNTDAHVELLWSLSRAPDADTALRAMVRLADALGNGWDELNRALVKDRACAAGCSGCSARRWRWATTSSPTRSPGTCWPATVTLPSAENCGDAFAEVAEKCHGHKRLC